MANLTSITNKYPNGNLTVDIILQEALDTFSQDLGILGSIHRDFGGEAMRFNQSIQTRIFATRNKSEVVDWNDVANANTHSYNDGDEDQDAEPVTITLDQHKYIKFHLTDLEREQTSVSYISEAAKYAAHALAQKVTEDLLEKAFDNDTVLNGTQIPIASFDVEDIFDVAKHMDDENMPKSGRWMVIDHSVYYQLLKTLTTISNATYDVKPGINRALVDQTLGGFSIYTYNGLGALTGGQKVLAGYEGSLAMVNRLPEFADASMQIGDIANATEPSSGLSLQLRRKYDVFDAKEQYALTIMYGLEAPKDSTTDRIFSLNVS